MTLTGLALQNFRLHKNYSIKFTQRITVIIGANAIGKTSIVEAIYLLATGNSFRAGRIEEMIEFDSELSRVKGLIVESKEKAPTDEIEIILTRGMVGSKRTQHRLFSVNGVRRRKKDAVGKFNAVVFRPEDMRLIEGSPSRRRAYLDTVLCMLFLEYEVALKNYDQTLKRRNKLLQQIKEQNQPKTVLQYWNLSLIKYGEILQKFRKDFLESIKDVEFPLDFSIEYDPSIISTERINQYQTKEIFAGHTLIGPHKDDIIVYLNSWRPKKEFSAALSSSKNKKSNSKINNLGSKSKKIRLDAFGSRGQQRLGVLWLKFCELEYLKNQSDKNTLLLLDDILSELDDDSKALALSVVENYQSIITSTEPAVLEDIKHVAQNIEVVYL